MNMKKLYWVDFSWNDNYNEDAYKRFKSNQYLQLKTFKDINPFFEEIKKLNYEVIFVLIRGRLYQDYYFKLKDLRSTLKCTPVSVIFSNTTNKRVFEGKDLDKEGVLKKETIASVGDDYFNKGGVVTTPSELIQFIENYLGYEIEEKIEEKLFHFENIKDDYENLILPCLYSKVQSRNIKLDHAEIKEFNEKLSKLHPFQPLSDALNGFLKMKKNIPIENIIKFWINYFSGENTFYSTMHKEFRENNFSNYNAFCKALYRGLSKNYLKNKFDVPLFFGIAIPKDDFETLEKNINDSKKELIYSRQILCFSQDKKVCFKFLPKNDDKNFISALLEVNKSNILETYSNNVTIEEFSRYPTEKVVVFCPYSCFVIEDKIEEMKENGLKYKRIKLNYLGKYEDQMKPKLEGLNKLTIDRLLNSKSKFAKNISNKFSNEFPNLEQKDLIKRLDIESKLIKDKLTEKENFKYPKYIIKIKMEKHGKFLSDEFFNNYNWMLKVYFDDVLQEEETNEITGIPPEEIKLEIDFPIYDCQQMFYSCEHIKEIDFVEFDTSKVTNMRSMFSDCDSLVKVNVDKFDTSKVTNMSCMFYKCSSLKKLDLLNFKINNVTDMSAMFLLCISLSELKFDLSNLEHEKLKDISYIFRCCYKLNTYDLSGLDLSKIDKKDGYI